MIFQNIPDRLVVFTNIGLKKILDLTSSWLVRNKFQTLEATDLDSPPMYLAPPTICEENMMF